MNNSTKAIKEAYKKGYKITEEGEVIGLKKKKLKLYISNTGYYVFTIRAKHISKNVLKVPVHRYQAYIKYKDEIFNNEIVVRHLNGNCLDNTCENIAIGNQSDNMMDIPKEQRIQNASNPKHDHKLIIEDRNDGMTYKELMKKYNISSKGTISFIINKSLAQNLIL